MSLLPASETSLEASTMGSSAASLTSTRSYGAALYNHGRRSAPAIRYAGHQAIDGVIVTTPVRDGRMRLGAQVAGLVVLSLLVPVIICFGKLPKSNDYKTPHRYSWT